MRKRKPEKWWSRLLVYTPGMWLGVRQAVAVVAAALCSGAGWTTLGACSGGYPLPPTACDEYCNATLGSYCPDFYDPAGCVAECERSHAAPPECRAELDAVISCYAQHPDETQSRCSYDPNRVLACAIQTYALQMCAQPQQYQSVPGYPNR